MAQVSFPNSFTDKNKYLENSNYFITASGEVVSYIKYFYLIKHIINSIGSSNYTTIKTVNLNYLYKIRLYKLKHKKLKYKKLLIFYKNSHYILRLLISCYHCLLLKINIIV